MINHLLLFHTLLILYPYCIHTLSPLPRDCIAWPSTSKLPRSRVIASPPLPRDCIAWPSKYKVPVNFYLNFVWLFLKLMTL